MKKFIFITLGIVVLATVIYFAICSFTYSDGSRSGILMKFSKKGFIFKTYEGDINVGFINTNKIGLTANVFSFSVEGSEKEAIEILNNSESQEIKIYYKEKIKTMPWQGETNYLIYKVERVNQ